MKVYTVCGWADWNGRFTTNRLHPFLTAAGFEVEASSFGFHLIVTPHTEKWAKALTEQIKEPSYAIGHSHGSLILQRASMLGARLSRLVLLNPAMDTKATFGPVVERVDVFYTPMDLPVRFGSWFPFSHPWGSAGVEGVTTGDPRVHNHNMMDYEVQVKSHLGIFAKDRLKYWGPRAVAALLQSEPSLAGHNTKESRT